MEPEELEWKTRKPMTMYGSKHYKTDVDRLYLQRCEGGGGLIGLKDCVHVEAHSLEKYLSTLKEKILSWSKIIENKSMEEVKKK